GIGPFPAESRPGQPGVLVRYEVKVTGREWPVVIEIGDAKSGDHVPVRAGGEKDWAALSLAGLELGTAPAGEFRSRRLLDLESADVQEVEVGPGPLHLVRGGGGRLDFKPPESWGWKFMNKPRQLPLDPTAQADFLQALVELEAVELAAGPAF